MKTPNNPDPTAHANLPAGVREALLHALPIGLDNVDEKDHDRILTALAPFWSVQNTNAEWAKEAAAFEKWLNNDYFWPGGLFNPELANHQVVSMKLMEIRDFLAKLAHAPTPVPSDPAESAAKEIHQQVWHGLSSGNSMDAFAAIIRNAYAPLIAELEQLRGFYDEIVSEVGHDRIINEHRQRGRMLSEEANWRKEAEAELARVAKERDEAYEYNKVCVEQADKLAARIAQLEKERAK